MAESGAGRQFYFDPIGRLDHVMTASGATINGFQYDGDEIVTEVGAGPTFPILRRYLRGPGSDEPLVWYEGAGTSDRRYLVADERGSVVAVTGATGTTLALNSYDEYGIPASTNLGRFQYTGQAWLPELGMYHYKARTYSPTLGRFMQTDPIGYDDGVNWYNYVDSDPVNNVDPSGLATCEDIGFTTIRPGSTNGTTVTGPLCDRTGPQNGGSGVTTNPVTLVKSVYRLGKSVFCGIFGCKKKKAAPAAIDPAAATPQNNKKLAKAKFCSNPVYQGLDFIDNAAGYGQLIALGGGAAGQAEPYASARAAFRAGALRGYAALGAARDLATVGKFFLGDRSTAWDLGKTLAVKGLGLDKAREVLADTFGALADKASGREDPCGN